MLVVGREGCQNVFGTNVYALIVQDCGAVERLRHLKNTHGSTSVTWACAELLNEYFPENPDNNQNTAINLVDQSNSSEARANSSTGSHETDSEVISWPICVVFDR